jgi:peptide chain release factor
MIPTTLSPNQASFLQSSKRQPKASLGGSFGKKTDHPISTQVKGGVAPSMACLSPQLDDINTSEYLHITSGQGPMECAWVATKVKEELEKDCTAKGVRFNWLELVPFREHSDLIKSALLKVKTHDVPKMKALLDQWVGRIQWKGKSQFRPEEKRQNWAIGISRVPIPDLSPMVEGPLNFEDKRQFRIERIRSSGPGGQKVNKTSSAIRITHLDSGIAFKVEDERSQHQNLAIAKQRITDVLTKPKDEGLEVLKAAQRQNTIQLRPGEALREYRGEDFELVSAPQSI